MKINVKNIARTIIFTALSSASLAVFSDATQSSDVSTIKAGDEIITMINILTPQPGHQQETVQLLQVGMQKTIQNQPGFISANIHRSLNSDHVAVYAQWKDQASVDAVTQLIQDGKAPNMMKVFTLAQPAYHPYEVVSIHSASKAE